MDKDDMGLKKKMKLKIIKEVCNVAGPPTLKLFILFYLILFIILS